MGIDGEAAFDEVAGGEGDAAPVFEGGEGVVGDEDGLHFFEVGVPVEGGVAAKEEVCYHADGPDVAFFPVVLLAIDEGKDGEIGKGSLHRFSVSGLLEYLRSHVARCSARCC